jgi:hypothetical protein
MHRVQAKIDKVMLTPVQFRDGSKELDPTSIPQIRQISKVLEEFPHFGIHIQGNFGQPGGMWANADRCMQMAKMRVTCIREALWQEGSMNPVSENHFGNANSMDQRISFTVVAPAGIDGDFLHRPKPETVQSNSPIALTSSLVEVPGSPRRYQKSSQSQEAADLASGVSSSPESSAPKRKTAVKKKPSMTSNGGNDAGNLRGLSTATALPKKKTSSGNVSDDSSSQRALRKKKTRSKSKT